MCVCVLNAASGHSCSWLLVLLLFVAALVLFSFLLFFVRLSLPSSAQAAAAAHPTPSTSQRCRLQFVQVLGQIGQTLLKSLTFTGILDNLVGLAGWLARVTGQHLPMVEHALREGLSTGVGAQIGGEAERLVDGQIRLDDEHGGTDNLVLLEHVTTTPVQHTVDATNGNLGTLNLAQIDGLHKAGAGRDGGGVQATTGCGNDLATTAMDGISVKGDIVDVEAHTTQILIGHDTFLGGPLETSDNRILDFVKVLHGLGAVEDEVGSSAVGAEAPDLTSLGHIVVVLLGQITGAHLEIILGAHITVVNVLGQTVGHGQSLHQQTVVLVGRLGQAHLVGLLSDGFTVRHNGVGLLQRDASVILLQILKANFQMQFTGTGNDVLARLLNDTLHHRIGLGQTLQTLHQFGKISGVLGLNSHTHDRRHGELHHLQVEGESKWKRYKDRRLRKGAVSHGLPSCCGHP